MFCLVKRGITIFSLYSVMPDLFFPLQDPVPVELGQEMKYRTWLLPGWNRTVGVAIK